MSNLSLIKFFLYFDLNKFIKVLGIENYFVTLQLINNITKMYPIKFKPILKERIWGGQQLKTLFNKPIVSDTTGESWEVSGVPGDISV